jgi:hypothetical protein
MMPLQGIHKGDKEFFEYNLLKKQKTEGLLSRISRNANPMKSVKAVFAVLV